MRARKEQSERLDPNQRPGGLTALLNVNYISVKYKIFHSAFKEKIMKS